MGKLKVGKQVGYQDGYVPIYDVVLSAIRRKCKRPFSAIDVRRKALNKFYKGAMTVASRTTYAHAYIRYMREHRLIHKVDAGYIFFTPRKYVSFANRNRDDQPKEKTMLENIVILIFVTPNFEERIAALENAKIVLHIIKGGDGK